MEHHCNIKKVSASCGLSDIVAPINADGAVIVEGMLGKKQLQSFNNELDLQFDRMKFCDGLFFGRQTKRAHSLIAKSQACREIAITPLVLEVVGQILQPYCDTFQLNLTQGIQIWPGERAQYLHRDDAMFPARQWCCEYMINAMWACTEFTEENGATVVVPGSHKWKDRTRRPKVHEAVQAEMVPGDVLLYLGSVIHGGGENRSHSPRTGVVIGYSLGWLRQYENQYLAVPPELAKNYPKLLQDLLGYRVHRPNLGMYEGEEPSVLFSPPTEFVTHDFLNNQQVCEVAEYVAKESSHAA